MGFSISSEGLCQLKSVSLRTNEKFVRLCNDVTEAWCLKFRSPRVLDERVGLVLIGHKVGRVISRMGLVRDREIFLDRIMDFDKLIKRAETNAIFSEVLAGIMLQFEQRIFPFLWFFRDSVRDERWCPPSLSTTFLLFDYKKSLLQELLEVFAECVSSGLESAYKLVVSALVLLSFVYQYLIGCVDKGGSKTYSPGSFLFRLIFVAIVLFLGSYVWIKSRQASFNANRRKRKSCQLADRASHLGDESDVPGGVYRRAVKNTKHLFTHYKYEPRFKPGREKLESGTSKFNYLPLGSYDTPGEAKKVYHIAAVLYGKEEGRPVQFEDGPCLPFPSVTEQETCPPFGKEKAVWVADKTKELYAELLEEKARRLQLLLPALATGSHHGHDCEARRSDPSPSAPVAHSSAIELPCFTSSHGGNGFEERATSESHSLGQEQPLAREVFSASFPLSDFEQVISRLPQWEENDFLAMDDLDMIEGDYSETGFVFGFECTLVPPQSSALDIPTTAIVAGLPQLGVVDQGLENIEPHSNSATAITFQQLESLPEQVQLQLRVTCEEKRPEDFSGSNLELQQKLLESEVRNSELQQKLLESEDRNSELRKAKVENENWRSMFRQWRFVFRQLDKLIAASDEDGNPVDIQ